MHIGLEDSDDTRKKFLMWSKFVYFYDCCGQSRYPLYITYWSISTRICHVGYRYRSFLKCRIYWAYSWICFIEVPLILANCRFFLPKTCELFILTYYFFLPFGTNSTNCHKNLHKCSLKQGSSNYSLYICC